MNKIGIRTSAPSDPLVARARDMLVTRIRERCATTVDGDEAEARIVLDLDKSLPAEAFRMDDAHDTLHITGGSPRGLLYGVGKFLRTSRYGKEFEPSRWRGTAIPRGSLRGMYFATHFHNWYHMASEAEIVRYTEDLALWGVNAIVIHFPMLNLQDWSDPEAVPATMLVRRYGRAAHDLGLQFGAIVGNAMFRGAPETVRAARLPDPTGRRGNSGHPVCPSTPQGHAYTMANMGMLFERLADIGLDLLCHWPYDEGGCACEKCRPWGCNGYLGLSRDLSRLGREFFPHMKTILSTWMFDTPPEGEWQGLAEALTTDSGWADYILADAHEDFPRYPLDAGVPGDLPLINFPEISMWGNWPWGGVGAHPLPARFQRLWNQVKRKVEGGLPYSEGIYEDMNKAVVAQFYWDPDRSARATLGEYIDYEFDPGVRDDVLELVDLLETTASRAQARQVVDADTVRRASGLADAVQARLPSWAQRNWRWEILRLRAVLDRERFAGSGLASPEAEAALRRLMELYHCQMETDDPYHHRVRPPLRQAVSRGGTC